LLALRAPIHNLRVQCVLANVVRGRRPAVDVAADKSAAWERS
jgi:hypothetical protein